MNKSMKHSRQKAKNQNKALRKIYKQLLQQRKELVADHNNSGRNENAGYEQDQKFIFKSKQSTKNIL